MVLDGHGPRDGNGIPFYKGALHGMQIWWVTKDYPTAEKIWRDIKEYLKRWGGELLISQNLMRIEFPGGGSLTVKSAHNPDALRGETLDGVVLDEAAFCHEDTWALSLRPTLLRREGWAVLISTPKGMNWFYEEWLIGSEQRDDQYRSWHRPSSDNPTLPPRELERARAKCGAYVYAREYLAEFNVKGGTTFERAWFRLYVDQGGVLQGLGPDSKPVGDVAYKNTGFVFLTADLASTVKTHSDYSVCAAWMASDDGRLWLLDLYRGKLEAPNVVPMLRRMYDDWQARVVVVEAAGPLVRLNAEARETGMNVHEVHIHAVPSTEKKDKVTRALPAAAAVQAGRVYFPRGAPFLNEFISECCAFPDPAVKDDQVDALSLAVGYRLPKRPPDTGPPAPRIRPLLPTPSWGTGMRRDRRTWG